MAFQSPSTYMLIDTTFLSFTIAAKSHCLCLLRSREFPTRRILYPHRFSSAFQVVSFAAFTAKCSTVYCFYFYRNEVYWLFSRFSRIPNLFNLQWNQNLLLSVIKLFRHLTNAKVCWIGIHHCLLFWWKSKLIFTQIYIIMVWQWSLQQQQQLHDYINRMYKDLIEW